MRKLILLTVLVIMALAAIFVSTPAEAVKAAEAAETSDTQNKAIFTRPLIWRADSSADYSFKGASLTNVNIEKDGSVTSGISGGTCELPNPYKTDGLITGLSTSWSFTGKVTLEVSITGNAKDYVEVTNGVPGTYKEAAYGSKIKWRATLGPDSTLTELKIIYSDLSGVVGSFGESSLSGFGARKQIYIKGSTAGTLFNYQMPIKAGESQKSAAGCDFKLNGGILSDFADIRFTQADGETALPHYLESVSGKIPNRTAIFWIKVPEIPKDGVSIYMYYSKTGASDLSSGEKVFDFFDDFEGSLLNGKRWKVTLYDKKGNADVKDSVLSLEMARITSADYKFAGGLIEYKAKASANSAVGGIIRAALSSDNDVIAYSSASQGSSGHGIAKGSSIKKNDPKTIAPETYYTYKIYCDDNGDIAFRRYGEDGSGTAEAETEYSAGTNGALPIGLLSSSNGKKMHCDWIRTRKAANPPAQIDVRTASTSPEATNLPEFYNVDVAADGSLIAGGEAGESYYISRLISPAFDARIIKPSWDADLSDEGAVSITIATKKGGKFYSGWTNGVARYVSKKEFEKGSQLRWKTVIAIPPTVSSGREKQSSSLYRFSLEYRPGTIRVVMPKGGETLTPGAEYSIFWESPGYDLKYPMEISYSKGEGKEFEVIAPKADNSGDYAWYVPISASGKALVRVADYYDKSVYGMSTDYFTIVQKEAVEGAVIQETEEAGSVEAPAPVEEKKVVEPPKPVEKSLDGQYDLLIKVGDNPSPDGYKDGDIVMVKPAGYLWGAEERRRFLIVRAHLTPKRALELMQPDEIVTLVGKSNRKITKTLKKRKYRFNLQDKITLQERAMASQGHLTGNALEIADIAAETERK